MSADEKKILIPEIVRSPDLKITVPREELIPLHKVIDFLKDQLVYEQKEVKLSETINCFIYDGCLALQKALLEVFGFAQQEEKVIEIMGMKIKLKPQQLSVECGVDKKVTVPWGQFALPGIEGWVQTSWSLTDEGSFVFRVDAQCRHKDEERVRKLFQRTREIAAVESIYRGKAIQVKFLNEDGEMIPMPQPRFVRLTDSPVIFQRHIEKAIESNILARIKYSDMARMATGKLKYGMLLAGPYGTGKTLTANMVAKVCQDHGWTFIYVKDIKELSIVLKLAQTFEPAVVFGEDIDRTAGVNRTDDVNNLLNTLDGLGTKSDKIITILTTNHADNINEAMRRPGRIDLVLEVKPPDKEAAERLIRLYAGNTLKEGEDLKQAAALLEGKIPAVIREAVERAAMEAITRSEGMSTEVEAVDIQLSAGLLIEENKLFRKEQDRRTPMEVLGTATGDAIGRAMSREIAKANLVAAKPMTEDYYPTTT